MALDDKIESAAYDAVNAVCAMPWPKQKERILRAIVIGIMAHMNWETLTIKDEKNDPAGT
jgi:hypothetical protein